jgi:hypothetical protein
VDTRIRRHQGFTDMSTMYMPNLFTACHVNTYDQVRVEEIRK